MCSKNTLLTDRPRSNMDMDIDTPISDSIAKIQVIMPNGTRKEFNASQTVAEIIKNCVTDENHEDYALIFYGRKLQAGQNLQNVKHLNGSRPVRLVRQNIAENIQKKEEIDKLLKDCRLSYKILIEEAYNPQISSDSYQMLLTFIVANHGEEYGKAVKEFSKLPFDQLGQDIARDWRLLIPYLMENDQFAREHPHCLKIFKKALDAVSAKYSSASTSFRFGDGPAFAGPSFHNPGGLGGGAAIQQPVITQQQLSQALALALGGGGNTPAAIPQAPVAPVAQPEGRQNPSSNAATNFAAQLQQMHEFGFMNDEENIQALVLTNGDVEQALQIVIAMHE